MIDAARRWKARATAGCAQALDPEPQACPRSSPARHGRAASPDEARRFCSERPKRPSPFAAVEQDQRVCFEAVLSLMRLSTSRRPTTRQMVDECSGRPNGLRGRGEPSCDGRREIVEMRDKLSRTSESSVMWRTSHLARNASPAIDTASDRVHTHRQSNRSACVPVRRG